MMDKILVEISVPAMNTSYDVFIPPVSPMYEVLELIKRAVNILAGGQYNAMGTSVLCFASTGSIVNINLSVHELGLRNGSKLMLI